MGVCHNFRKKNVTIKVKQKTENDSEKLREEKEKQKTITTHIKDVQYSNFPTAVSDKSPQSKFFSAPENNVHNHSNLSSGSCFVTPHSSLIYKIEATLGEVELPIYVEKNENIIVQINPDDNNSQITWSFLQKENPINYLGYQNYKYKEYNLGALFLRISGSDLVYLLDKNINAIKASSNGNLLFSANLDPNDYSIYEPKGSLSLKIIGGNIIDEAEFYSPYPYDINNYTNKNINNNFYNQNLNEKKILKYINKARKNLLEFFKDYFYNYDNNKISQELIEFVDKNNMSIKDLTYSEELNIIAKEHCEDLCINGISGNIGTDGSNLQDRLKKYNIKSFYNGENIMYGINNPLLIVKKMIEDKYSKSKNNRKNIFSPQFTKVGVYLREHIAYKYCCVVVFSE